MRSINSIKNISVGVISQLIIVLLGFISRKVFIDSLGINYLGINGLLDNILSILALVESGIGSSIIYHLYKPLAENNKTKVIAFIKLYKNAYRIIAFVILGLSVITFPFVGKLIKNSEQIPYFTIVYFIFVAKNMTYYLNAYKVALINADQKGYVLAKVNLLFQILITFLKIIILLVTQNYVLYLFVELLLYVIQNVINGKVVDKQYSYIKTKEEYTIQKEERESLIINIKALFFHNIGTYVVFGTDNILISIFIGVTSVGIYSNYSMIIGQLGSLIAPLLGGIGASVGNLIASEDKEKNYEIFKVTYLINFWIYSIAAIFLFNLVEPFIHWWLGKDFLLDQITFIVLLINFYINGLRITILTFKSKGGIFVQDKYMPLVEAFINLAASLILVKNLGLAGIFIGTTISTLLTVFWNAPRLVFKNIFEKPVLQYFNKYIFYITITTLTCYITTLACDFFVNGDDIFALIKKGIIALTIPNMVYFILFYKSKEFQYIKSAFNNTFSNLKIKLNSAG